MATEGMDGSEFLVAENPFVDDGRFFIVRVLDPVIIAEAFHFEEDQETEWIQCKSQFTIASSVNHLDEIIVLGVIFCAPLPKGFSNNAHEEGDKLAEIMSRMSDWYHNYLKWQGG